MQILSKLDNSAGKLLNAMILLLVLYTAKESKFFLMFASLIAISFFIVFLTKEVVAFLRSNKRTKATLLALFILAITPLYLHPYSILNSEISDAEYGTLLGALEDKNLPYDLKKFLYKKLEDDKVTYAEWFGFWMTCDAKYKNAYVPAMKNKSELMKLRGKFFI